jgi:ABC-type nitrate/sulfonate/bicarbonate transport system substrate-binding protein
MVSAFLTALAEATQWFRGHVEESAAIAAARTSMDTRYSLGACQKLAADGVIPPDQRSAPAAIGAVVEALRSSGQLGDGPDPLGAAVDYSYL